MDNNEKNVGSSQEEQTFPMREYLTSCLAAWKWFVVSIIVFVCIGYLYGLRKVPVYNRTMSILVTDLSNNGGLDVSSSFSQLGFGGGNTNVNNELISLTSPYVMYEVVKRLQLNVSLVEKGFFHGTTLYGASSPLEIEYPELNDKTNISFRIDLNPDNTYRLYKFQKVIEGKRIKFNGEVIGKVGFEPVKTPVGILYIRPNGKFAGPIKDEMQIFANITSYEGATESYSRKLKGDLANSDAEVINLSFDDTSVARAQNVLNTIVEVYNEFWAEDKNKVNVATIKFIEERLATISKELGSSDNEIADYKSRNKIIHMGASGNLLMGQQSTVEEDILKVNNQLAMARYMKDYITNPGNNLNVIPAATGVGNGSIDNAIREYNALVLKRSNIVASSGENNPIVMDYDSQIKGLRESIIRGLNGQVGNYEATLKSLEKAQKQNEDNISGIPQQQNYLESVMREHDVKESLYVFLLQKLEETQLAQTYTVSNTRVITPPWGPRRPISPKKPLILIFCFMLGVAIPGGLIYIRIMTNDTVNSRKDLDDLPLPFTGEIPHVGEKDTLKKYLKTRNQRKRESDRPKSIVSEGKRDVPNEAFRVVRSNIDLMIGRESSENIIMVTSFNPGSGKSFITFNLGASFALKNKKVLLIDGDLRHGSLSTYVGSPRKGLSAYLSGGTDDVDSLIRNVEEFKTLDVMPIGHRPPNPAELLETDRFGELLDIVKKEYDIILVDCPPVNVVVDTQLLNRYADRTIFVVRAGLLKKNAVKDLVGLYAEKKLNKMSILLNGTEEGHSTYYTYGNYQSLAD